MMRVAAWCVAALSLGLTTAHADNRLGLKRGGKPDGVTISGVSSGAAMAVQYAVALKDEVGFIAPDVPFGWFGSRSPRRRNLDLADKGYIYVPPACRPCGSSCQVHVALHGCKQDPKVFA